MSARRTSSTTSLSKYARRQAGEDDIADRSLDFCNAFWGIADGGYDVLLTRMRGATRTTEELKAFWKERAGLEEDYAKRLSKLAKQVLGRDEIGELRNSIDTLRLETEKQAVAHSNLAQDMRKNLELSVVELVNKQAHFKRNSQASIEKSYKAKQTQEVYVKKARQKYEDDCVRINSYTAQSTLVQGKDLEKIQLKLEKAKQTVQANEREFSQYARALADTTNRWEREWKVFCDSCQDLEEERLEFMKDNIWSYANAVSTVCVSDDESCEKIRIALEQLEIDKDMENFVRDYNTGPQIPDPPGFVDYNTLGAGQSPSGSTWRTANFARSTNRVVGPPLRQPPPEEEVISVGHAGIGAGGGRSLEAEKGAISRSNSAVAVNPATNGVSSLGSQNPSPSPTHGAGPSPQSAMNQGAASSSSQPVTSPPSAGHTKGAPSFRAPQTQDAHSEPIDPRAETLLKVGANAYPVNLGEDPQRGGVADAGRAIGNNVGEQDDPLARQAAELRNAAGSVRRGIRGGTSPVRKGSVGVSSPPGGAGPSLSTPGASGSSISIPNGQPSTSGAPVNYHTQAESVVGGPPPAVSQSSPKPPTASFMIPPEKRSKSPLPVEDVVSSYQRPFPGERRRSISQSREGEQGESSGSGPIPRPVSPAREGHVGIGAHGGSRSNSPQPPSPGVVPRSAAPQHQSMSHHAPPAQQGQVRATSPLGIALDETGNVAHDTLAERMYNQQQGQGQPRRASFYGQSSLQQQPAPQAPSQPAFGGFPPQGSGYVQPQQPRQYPQQPPPPTQPPPQPHQQLPPQVYNAQSPQNPQRQGPGLSAFSNPQGSLGRHTSANAVLTHPQYSSQAPPQQQRGYSYPDQPQQRPGYGAAFAQHGQQISNGYQQPYRPAEYNVPQGYQQPQAFRAPSPAHVHRSPSPAVQQRPSPAVQQRPSAEQFTDEGENVLFYVKALYDYQATIDEEFDFQAGDIIAVTATPEDGWWSGMLLDEMRRIPGKTIFPSNFVALF